MTACSPRAKLLKLNVGWMVFALIGEVPRVKFSDCASQQFSLTAWQRRMVAQPRRQTSEKRCSMRWMQINRPRSNKPNRVDRLGKPGVHQY
jgi:hypothetical protein